MKEINVLGIFTNEYCTTYRHQQNTNIMIPIVVTIAISSANVNPRPRNPSEPSVVSVPFVILTVDRSLPFSKVEVVRYT